MNSKQNINLNKMYKISVEKILEIRKKLSRKKLVTSAWMQLSNSNLTELMCSAKFDCVTFDFEHGLFSVKDLPDLFRVFIDVTSPFIVETSRLWDAFPSAFLSWSIMTILCDSCARSLDR